MPQFEHTWTLKKSETENVLSCRNFDVPRKVGRKISLYHEKECSHAPFLRFWDRQPCCAREWAIAWWLPLGPLSWSTFCRPQDGEVFSSRLAQRIFKCWFYFLTIFLLWYLKNTCVGVVKNLIAISLVPVRMEFSLNILHLYSKKGSRVAFPSFKWMQLTG